MKNGICTEYEENVMINLVNNIICTKMPKNFTASCMHAHVPAAIQNSVGCKFLLCYVLYSRGVDCTLEVESVVLDVSRIVQYRQRAELWTSRGHVHLRLRTDKTTTY